MPAIEELLERGVLPASALRDSLGVSAATLMRMVREQRQRVVRIGRTRATRYGLRRSWPGLVSDRFPLIRIDHDGSPTPVGELVTLAARQAVWLPEGKVSDGLPVEIADARPSGFLGRHFAAQHPDLAIPARLADWSDHHVLLALTRRGEDLTGSLLVGDESFVRWQTLTIPAVSRDDYPRLAAETVAGHPPGSSAGGERPKFGARFVDRHVLVKFAARGSAGDEVANRWCDLLVLEALALEVVASRGITTATTTLVDAGNYVFLESERFDRAGIRGRIGVISLAAAHQNPADTWARAATILKEAGRLAHEDARKLCWLDAYGALIGNTDRHHHNIAFFTSGELLRLAPAFDQLPMVYAPLADGQVLQREFVAPVADGDTLDVWDDARQAAREFWARAGVDRRLTGGMRQHCLRNASKVKAPR